MMETEDEDVVDAPDDVDDDDFSAGESNAQTRQTAQNCRSRHKSDVYIAEGFHTDCENILKQFLAKQTSTFEDFVSIWQEKKFSSIFNGRDSYAEVLEFSEEALIIAKSFILPPHSQIKRIGALYLMYGLYTQQPYRDVAKFRVSPQEWSVILKFVDNLKVHGFIDANYIFHKMCLDGAFLTVAFTREYGLERNFRKHVISWHARDKELEPGVTFSLDNLMGRVYRGSLKSAADKLRSKYNDIKKKLADKNETSFQSLNGTEKDLEQVILDNMFNPAEYSSQTLGDTKKISDLGGGRRSIINKAFTHKTLPKVSQCSLLLENPDKSAVSTSQPSNDKTTKSQDEILELESDSEGNDFKYVMNPPSMRNSKRLKTSTSKQDKSQDQRLSLGQNKKGPCSYDFCYEEVTGIKSVNHSHRRIMSRKVPKSPNQQLNKVDQTDSAIPTEVAKEINPYKGAQSCPTLDDDALAQALPEGLDGAKPQLHTPAVGRRQRKQIKSVSIPHSHNETDNSSTDNNQSSFEGDTTATIQTKKGRRISVRKSNLTPNPPQNNSYPVSEISDKVAKASRKSKKSSDLITTCHSLETHEDKTEKSTKRSRKSNKSTNIAGPSSEIPEKAPIESVAEPSALDKITANSLEDKSKKSSRRSRKPIKSTNSPGPSSEILARVPLEPEPGALDQTAAESPALSPKAN